MATTLTPNRHRAANETGQREARERLRDPSAINMDGAEYDRLMRIAGYSRDGLGYVTVTTVEKATEPSTSEETIAVATFAEGAARANAAKERISKLRNDPAWLDESAANHRQVCAEIEMLYKVIGENQ